MPKAPDVAVARGRTSPAVASDDTTMQFQKAFLASCDAFLEAHPRLPYRLKQDLLEAGAQRMYAKYGWKSKATSSETGQQWRNPLATRQAVSAQGPSDFAPDEVASIKMRRSAVAEIQAFVQANAPWGIHAVRQVVEEGVRNIFLEHDWSPSVKRRGGDSWRSPRSKA